MIIISHRGNLKGKDLSKENNPAHLQHVMGDHKIMCEVDLWLVDNELLLGHDFPEYKIDESFLESFANFLVIHAKDLNAANWLYDSQRKYNWFYHKNDEMTLTSHGWIWSYPGIYMDNGVVVELGPPNTAITLHTRGVCTDYPLAWLEKMNKITV